MTLINELKKMSSKQKRILSGVAFGTLLTFLVFMLNIWTIESCGTISCIMFLMITMGPGTIINDLFSIANIKYWAELDFFVSLTFYFIIGFLLGLLYYRLKHE